MSTFSHLHSLRRTPYLLKYKSSCSLDKEKQVYMCVRHMGKMFISSPSSSTISYPFTQTQANFYCLIYGTMDHGQKLVIQVQERMPTQETKEKEHGILTTLWKANAWQQTCQGAGFGKRKKRTKEGQAHMTVFIVEDLGAIKNNQDRRSIFSVPWKLTPLSSTKLFSP